MAPRPLLCSHAPALWVAAVLPVPAALVAAMERARCRGTAWWRCCHFCCRKHLILAATSGRLLCCRPPSHRRNAAYRPARLLHPRLSWARVRRRSQHITVAMRLIAHPRLALICRGAAFIFFVLLPPRESLSPVQTRGAPPRGHPASTFKLSGKPGTAMGLSFVSFAGVLGGILLSLMEFLISNDFATHFFFFLSDLILFLRDVYLELIELHET
jgi:hypothetical protein